MRRGIQLVVCLLGIFASKMPAIVQAAEETPSNDTDWLMFLWRDTSDEWHYVLCSAAKSSLWAKRDVLRSGRTATDIQSLEKRLIDLRAQSLSVASDEDIQMSDRKVAPEFIVPPEAALKEIGALCTRLNIILHLPPKRATKKPPSSYVRDEPRSGE